jgi:hypothetical protein
LEFLVAHPKSIDFLAVILALLPDENGIRRNSVVNELA